MVETSRHSQRGHSQGARGGGLYRPSFEHDSCGFGLIAQMDDRPSHWLVASALGALGRMTHRGAIAADGKTGDGCGILIKLPEDFLASVADELGFALGGLWTAGAVFLHPDAETADGARQRLEAELAAEQLSVAGWRAVPVEPEACGAEALRQLPRIEQPFVSAPEGMAREDFHRRLFIARRRTENALAAEDPVFYVASLSAYVIAYKALVMPRYLPIFYPDLEDRRLASSIAVFHQRFSTNTWPQWRLAQPFRYLAHNGEINTIQGNRYWALARSVKLASPFLEQMAELQPVVSMDDSDSCSLDNMLELMLAGGLDVCHAMRMLTPPAWQNVENIDADIRAFYEYHSLNMDPWDGPAGIVLTDGRYAACALDRNGLRPARYAITEDRHIILASETGPHPYAAENVVAKGRLGPGAMVAVDTETGELLSSKDIDERLKAGHPYKDWLNRQSRYLEASLADPKPMTEPLTEQWLNIYQKLFNVTYEERDQVLRVLAEVGLEAVSSMGDDTPMPVLSRHVRNLYDYFRQQFAQVTNPPIDPLREQMVMSLESCFGPEANLFHASEREAKRVVIDSPVLAESKYRQLLNLHDQGYPHTVIDLNFSATDSLSNALERICHDAELAVRDGALVLILDDRNIDSTTLPAHALLATGAVHHHLVNAGLRCDANLVVSTATARDPHHFACLIGYGATAVYPYLAYEILHDLVRLGDLPNDDEAVGQLRRRYRKGINKGLYKILSKMGISTIASYRGAQLFEIVGLADDVVDRCFKRTTSRIQGADFRDLEDDQRRLAKLAWNPRKPIAQGGIYKYLYNGEYHAFNPDVVTSLQAAVKSGDRALYREFAEHVNGRRPAMIRDLFELKRSDTPLAVEEVEPVDSILQRFESAGMSLGALSPEAHEALAIAMNRIGGRSNSGEGGEASERHGTEKRSKIKQIASGRFGVTPEYLVNCEVIQIKMAQGAKPGEGGQLPGHKVDQTIARLRYAMPGIGLISPPPHHDIYSIEDLAQLIFDLKQINPEALVSVKLVAAPGVGTVAAGVAKAYADLITISGYDGGTGASPLTSVLYAGSPWEMGLAETHQTLRANDLRDKVRLQTDGGLKTGLDVVKAAILGAESFGFGTAPLVALGCKFLRICHLNNCATGVATQNEVLRRKHFIGLPEMVVNYFRFVAEEARELMAELGVRSVEELVGRVDLLERLPGETERQRRLDLSPIVDQSGVEGRPQTCLEPKNEPFDEGKLAERMVVEMGSAIEHKSGGELSYDINNYDRSVGARVSGEIARRHGNQGMSEHPILARFRGWAGQSFGAWNAGGLHLHLDGDANDYVGKGMTGGKIVLRPPAGSRFASQDTPIMGNTCLYGATGGRLFAAGQAGERFAVRNSGALAVVEGCGDHGCEYMTGGVVAVLGETGVNFAAGMTGGFAYVLDLQRDFADRFNHELVDFHRIATESMEAHLHYLRSLIEEHVSETDSAWGREILEDFRSFKGKFWLVSPKAADVHALLDTLREAA